ncbi:hypothetical protein HIM_05208 [Hirsutella minnesotensis 3608]|uniref:Heme O synthase n=1 Tax=Hirsutella minnesotensis 3608 TaxID=1043627 RepID=A0A0F8A0E8_9HYPO|nr:hypothetical protein HIM_05208 [Hirsutella minnesotensis 3608]
MRPPSLAACPLRRRPLLARHSRPSQCLVSTAARRAALPSSGAAGFFLSNRLFERSRCLDAVILRQHPRTSSTSSSPSGQKPPQKRNTFTSSSSPPSSIAELPPHRRRQALKQAAESADGAMLPPNASSTLTSAAAASPARSLRRVLSSMSRTRNRPLVRGLISPRSAAAFALVAGACGVAALYYGVNPTVSVLGLSNIVLYAGIYTPLKAVTAFNTWFPHFMALSWPIREEYRAAGLRMLAWTNPSRNGRVALRYSLAFVPICVALCFVDVTEWSFAAISLPVNAWLVREAFLFWRHEGHAGTARGLFWASVWHLPVVMMLALLHKKGVWRRAWRSALGLPDLAEDGVWEDAELAGMARTAARVAEKGTTAPQGR